METHFHAGWSRRRLRSALVALLACAAVLALASKASAVVVHLRTGKALSYQPTRGHAPAAQLAQFDKLFTNLDYSGGPVMGSNTNYTVYWRPKTGPEYPAGYQQGVNQYFKDLEHDSGGHENVESVSAQYNDSSGEYANYNSHFGGALIDEDAYPANGCERAPICLTDEQLQQELLKYTAAHGLPRDLAHEYFLLTPPGVEDCFEAEGFECSAGAEEEVAIYCAYHGNIPVGGSQLIYANDPFVTGNFGCDEGNHPNGLPSDGVIEGGLSHEHNESTTDPEPNNAWTDWGGFTGEIGDKCRTFNTETEFGEPLGEVEVEGEKVFYNQVINGHFYWYQQEWSNQGKTCLQRLTFSGAAPVASFTSEPKTGTEMTFNASASTAPGGVFRYVWQFDDGHAIGKTVETSAPTVSHKFSAAGTYGVALTVMAEGGTSIGAARTIVTGDEGPTPAFSITTPSPTAAQPVSFDGSASSDSDGSIATYSWAFGDGSGSVAATGAKPSHTYTAAGTYTATLTITDSSGQTASVSHTVTVASGGGKKAQIITFKSAPPADATVGGPTYNVEATGGGSGNPVVFTIDASAASVCSISGATVSFKTPGTCVIDANQAGDAEWEKAPQNQQPVTVKAESSGPPPEEHGPPVEPPASPPPASPPPGSPPPTTTAPSVQLTQTTASAVLSTMSTPPPNSNFSIVAATTNANTGVITFSVAVVDPGTLSSVLTFPNGKFGVFTAATGKCKAGLTLLGGKCRPSKIVFGRGTRVLGGAGTVSFVVKPSSSALKALRRALARHGSVAVTATLTFQSSRGGAPVSHTRVVLAKLKKK